MTGGRPRSLQQARRTVAGRMGVCMFVRTITSLLVCAAVLLATAPSFSASIVASRDAPIYSKGRKVLGTIPKGAEAELLSVKGRWYEVRYTPAEGQPIEGWSRAAHFEKPPTYVEALRDTPILSEVRREIATMREGERAELLKVQDVHLLVRFTLADGKSVDGLVRKGDMIEAHAADFARTVKEVFEGEVQVRRAAGFEQHRTKTFGKQKTKVEIVSRSETVWLQIMLASKVPVSGLQIKYQFYKQVSDMHGKSRIVEGQSGVLTARGRVDERPTTFRTQFSKYEWEDQIVDPDQPAVSKRLPDMQIGELFHGYRVEVFWRGFFLKSFEENALPVEKK